MRFHKHYTPGEARQLLPQVRKWLDRLVELKNQLHRHDGTIASRMTGGADLGGEAVNAWVRCMGDMQGVLLEFLRREIQVKDIDRGLIDFPGLIDGKEVFFCWEKGEQNLEYWHELDAGYAGRQRLIEE